MRRVPDFLRKKMVEFGYDKAGLSRAIGRNVTYIQQYLEKGSPQNLPEETRHILAEKLGCSPDDFREETVPTRPVERGHVPPPKVVAPGPSGPTGGPIKDRTLPIFGRAQAGNYEVSIIRTDDHPIDWTYCPDQLAGVEHAYATFVYGDSMSPALEDGDIVFVHPHLPPRRGKNVHIILHDDRAFVKRFVRMNETTIFVEQFNPTREEIQFALKDVRYHRRIVGKWDG